jgi:bifunctional oligoribonuclease and PAP phosphatase NrnA
MMQDEAPRGLDVESSMRSGSQDELAAIAITLSRARRILVICHIAPDGDAIGSLLGLGWLFETLPPQHERTTTLACADGVPAQFAFLPGAGEILTDPPSQTWDAIVTVDASDERRLGACYRPDEYAGAPVIVLDHHVTNLNFGTLNYVDATAAATTQIVLELADALRVAIRPEAATCLLTGLVTDTLSFRTSNVTPKVLRVAARLMEAGAALPEITERALNQKPLSVMRLWGLALASLQHERQVVWALISREMRARAGAPDTGDGGLASFLISAPEAKVAAVLSEKPDGQVEVGLRARNGLDVSELALALGGGGHPQAAGCTIPGPLVNAEARLLPLLFACTEA